MPPQLEQEIILPQKHNPKHNAYSVGNNASKTHCENASTKSPPQLEHNNVLSNTQSNNNAYDNENNASKSHCKKVSTRMSQQQGHNTVETKTTTILSQLVTKISQNKSS